MHGCLVCTIEGIDRVLEWYCAWTHNSQVPADGGSFSPTSDADEKQFVKYSTSSFHERFFAQLRSAMPQFSPYDLRAV